MYQPILVSEQTRSDYVQTKDGKALPVDTAVEFELEFFPTDTGHFLLWLHGHHDILRSISVDAEAGEMCRATIVGYAITASAIRVSLGGDA